MTEKNSIAVEMNGEAPEREWTAYNYCVAFVDLLGQRDALEGQGLLRQLENDAQRKEFHDVMRNSIGAIIKLQDRADDMLKPILEANLTSPLRAKIPDSQKALWDEMQQTRITRQRWSDGLVSFVCLGDQTIKCRMNGVFGVLGLTGVLCLLGLATRHPIRGAIEIAWGVEIHAGELYGPAVARAYELESGVAQYPRIVVGPELVRFLQACDAYRGDDIFLQTDGELARLCLSLLATDTDGQWILHYLGKEFQDAISKAAHGDLYKKARQYVVDQLTNFQEKKNSKLAFRYAHLLDYFDAHPI